jgi:hypothetical protein
VHIRTVSFGLACLYVRPGSFGIGPLTDDLCGEFHERPYASVDFTGGRGRLVAEVVVPPSRLLRFAVIVQARYERHPVRALNAVARRRCAARTETEVAARVRDLARAARSLGALVLASTGTAKVAVGGARVG